MSLTLTRRHNVDRFGYLIPTKYGNVPMVGAVATYRPGEGRFGGAVAVEEGTTNLIDPLAVRMYSNNSSVWPVQDEPFGDHRRIRRNPDFETYPDSRFTTYTPAFYDHDVGIYTRSIKVKPERDVFLHLDISGEVVLCKAGIWTTLINVIEHTEQGTDRFPGIRAPLTEPFGFDFNPWIEYKDAQVEAKPFATSFVDGTRAAGRLSYPINFNMDEGTIHVWFYFNGATAWNTPRGTIFCTRQGSGGLRNHFWLFTITAAGYNSLFFQGLRDDGSAPINQSIKHFSDISDGWHSAVVRWSTSAQSLDVFLDGQLLRSYTYPIDGLLPFDTIDVGCRGTVDQSNTLLDELLILPYAASEEEIVSWYEAQGPLPPHPQALLQWDRQAVRPAQMVKL